MNEIRKSSLVPWGLAGIIWVVSFVFWIGLVLLLSSCGPGSSEDIDICKEDPCNCWEEPEFEFVVENSEWGHFDICYNTGEETEYLQRESVTWNHKFNSDSSDFYLHAVGDTPGIAKARFLRCGELIRKTECVCSFPILKLEISIE